MLLLNRTQPILGDTYLTMATLNTFNRHIDTPSYTGNYYFYTVDFMDIYSGQHYFRIIDAGVDMTHEERMAHFDADINGRMNGVGYDPRYTITAYELDMDEDEMTENGLRANVLHDTYWSAVLQGAA